MKYYKYAPWHKFIDEVRDGVKVQKDTGDYLRQNLLSNSIYLNSPAKFNDPFDSNPFYNKAATPLQIEQHLARIYMKREHVSAEKAKRKVKNILKGNPFHKDQHDIETFALNSKEGLRRSIGVSCFTTTPHNSAMWAHYAEDHTGICIEWDFPDGEEPFTLPPGSKKVMPLVLMPVTYNDNRPVIYLFKDSSNQGDAFVDSLLTKPPYWSYEEEYRVITPEYIGTAYYEPYRLSSLIIGYKMQTSWIDEIKIMVKKLKYQPRLFIAKPSPSRYKYEIGKLEA